MANGDYPILVFPAPAPADRARRFGGGERPKRPGASRQGERLTPQFQRLQDALENRRIALQGSSLGIDPEQVLVLETVGPVENFIRAVEKVEGLEWLAEYEVEDMSPGDGFEDANHPEKSLNGQLFLMMSDGRALAELQSLFNSWLRDPEASFSRGLAPLKHAFEHLREIRPWDVEDRLASTGLLDDWNERAAFGQETVSFEAELWYRDSQSRRRAAAGQLRQLVEALDGQIVTECIIQDIAYHAILGQIDIERVRGLLDQPEARQNLALFRCDDIMFLRPVGQCAVPIGDETDDDVTSMQPPDAERRTIGSPVVALLDGMPLTGHNLLDGRLVVDDPDGYEDAYQARERSHGTAMASLICHGDLDAQGAALDRPVYVRPIMQPRRGFDGRFVEAVPEDVLPVDLVHRAVVRMFDGEGSEPPAAPRVRVVSLSIGDPARPFVREMSGRVVTGAEQRVTVLGFGSLNDGQASEFALPLPPGLSGINVRRRVIITLAWFSPINSRRQGYRVAHLWFGAAGNIANARSCADHHAVQRGTVQHEVFEGRDAVAFQDGDDMIVKVNCREDAGDILQPVRFGLAVTLEVAENLLVSIPVYEEVRERIAVRVHAAVDAV